MWAFFAMDAALLVLAVVILKYAHRPWSEATIGAAVACVVVGAAIGLVPLIVYYERQKNEMLDDRQRALENLARTVAASAEQISIAANGLHEIAELAQKNLRHAEQLPHKLQEKIAEFQAQLANTNDTEKEELEKELEELRSSESERLQSISDKIAKTTAEFAKLEATTHQHLTAANEAVSKLAFGTAGAIGKAQAAAEQALLQARQEAARTIGDATGNATKAIETAKASAITEIAGQFDTGIARLKQAMHEVGAAPTKAPAPSEDHPAASLPPSAAIPNPDATGSTSASPTGDAHVSPPKKPRKTRRDEHAPSAEAGEATAPASPAPAADTPAPIPAVEAAPPEPAPITSEKIAEIAPVAPETAEPFSGNVPAPVEPPTEAKPPRKRAPKRSDEDQPGLGLSLGQSSPTEDNGEPTSAAGVLERVISSDGATRLIVTAYIGIGNRLFIRGSGPGLSWEKGVPLQFVSIGKWRWETNDASAPVQFKLLKNDEQECAGLGEQTIDPGHQYEVTAAFG
jgi:hypothetical protein